MYQRNFNELRVDPQSDGSGTLIGFLRVCFGRLHHTLSRLNSSQQQRREADTYKKRDFSPPLLQLSNMKITSGGMIKPVWSLTTLVEPDPPSHCRGPCEWRKNRKVILPGWSVDPNFGDIIDSPLRRTNGVRLIWQDRLPEQNQCSISEQILSEAKQ